MACGSERSRLAKKEMVDAQAVDLRTQHKARFRGISLAGDHSDRSAPGPTTSAESTSEDEAYERAIKASVAATSTGDPSEDKWIERAIQASVAELRRTTHEGSDDDALNRAINASIVEANKARSKGKDFVGGSEFDDQLALAMQRSLGLQQGSTTGGLDDPDVDTDDDENMRQALERSKSEFHGSGSHDEDFGRTVTKSLEESNARKREQDQSSEEERVVLEYVKKQSLLEEQSKETTGH